VVEDSDIVALKKVKKSLSDISSNVDLAIGVN
jgi:hypothetical protein